ncbi:MAG: hypothetical protein JO157_11285 [Acetobacteraceae bacterium]|nr:hypothetical protein [Acetobacteraceae bacterium]
MAQSRRTARTKDAAVLASGALADLRALAATPHPDAKLLVACERFTLLKEERERLYRKHERGYMDHVRKMAPEMDALELEIANTPARTAAGRAAKGEAAMCMLSQTGTFAQIARSALRDFINHGAADAGALA